VEEEKEIEREKRNLGANLTTRWESGETSQREIEERYERNGTG